MMKKNVYLKELTIILLILSGCVQKKSSVDDTIIKMAHYPISTWHENEANSDTAVTYYNYNLDETYKIYTTPGRVTLLKFAPDEKIICSPQGGDTNNFMLSLIQTDSNNSDYIIIKPLALDIATNIVVITNKRVYILDVYSMNNNYMQTIAWRYSKNKKPQTKTQSTFNLSTNKYRIICNGKHPAWYPLDVFDNGSKTYILLPAGNNIGLPMIKLINHNNKTQIIDFRLKNRLIIIDSLIDNIKVKSMNESIFIKRIEK